MRAELNCIKTPETCGVISDSPLDLTNYEIKGEWALYKAAPFLRYQTECPKAAVLKFHYNLANLSSCEPIGFVWTAARNPWSRPSRSVLFCFASTKWIDSVQSRVLVYNPRLDVGLIVMHKILNSTAANILAIYADKIRNSVFATKITGQEGRINFIMTQQGICYWEVIDASTWAAKHPIPWWIPGSTAPDFSYSPSLKLGR